MFEARRSPQATDSAHFSARIVDSEQAPNSRSSNPDRNRTDWKRASSARVGEARSEVRLNAGQAADTR
jgi:hypothetical protein